MLPSGGKSSIGPSPSTNSTPSRSRTVLAYSMRLSRRIKTRPPVLSALRCICSKFLEIHSVTFAKSAGAGRGSSSGGISPKLIRSSTSTQCPEGARSLKFAGKLSSRNSPSDRSSSWHDVQCLAKNGFTVLRNVASSTTGGAANTNFVDNANRVKTSSRITIHSPPSGLPIFLTTQRPHHLFLHCCDAPSAGHLRAVRLTFAILLR